MASRQSREERVKALVAEILAEEAAQGWDAESENINDIEEGMIRIGDQVAREFGRQKLATHMSQPPEAPACPGCSQAGAPAGQRTRQLITRRGEVPLTETKYHCPKCRRLFFPADQRVGS